MIEKILNKFGYVKYKKDVGDLPILRPGDKVYLRDVAMVWVYKGECEWSRQ